MEPEERIEEILRIDSMDLYSVSDEDLLHMFIFMNSIKEDEDLWNDELETQFDSFEDELLIRGII